MKKHEIKIIDQGLTTRCNLRCVFCNRQVFDYYPKKIDISIDLLKKIYTTDFVDQLERVIICGSWGDPIFYPHLEEFLELINYEKFIISTNGTMKTPEWWYQFGKKCKDSAYVMFAIDGLSNTYSKYRIGGSFKKVFRNMMFFIQGGGNAWWQYILFDYNQHDCEKAKEIANQIGVKQFLSRMSHMYNENFKKPDIYDYVKKDKENEYCNTIQANSISIDIQGDVTPCCHTRPLKILHHPKIDNKIIANYIKNRNEINLYHSTLEKALESIFFNYFIKNHNTITLCQRSCGYRKRYEVKKV